MVSLGLVEIVQGGVRSWHQEEKSPRASSSSPPLLPPPKKKGSRTLSVIQEQRNFGAWLWEGYPCFVPSSPVPPAPRKHWSCWRWKVRALEKFDGSRCGGERATA